MLRGLEGQFRVTSVVLWFGSSQGWLFRERTPHVQWIGQADCIDRRDRRRAARRSAVAEELLDPSIHHFTCGRTRSGRVVSQAHQSGRCPPRHNVCRRAGGVFRGQRRLAARGPRVAEFSGGLWRCTIRGAAAPSSAPPLDITRAPASRPEAVEPATASRAASAPGLSFKDDSNIEDPFGADPTPPAYAAIDEAQDKQAPGLLAPSATAAALPAAIKPPAASSKGLRLVAGGEPDLSDPFAEEPPTARTGSAAGLPRQIPDDFGSENEPAAARPGRASLSEDDDEMEADPFGSAPPPLQSLQPAPAKPAPVKPVPVPDDEFDPFGNLPGPQPLKSPVPAGRDSTRPRLPELDSEPDPFGAAESPERDEPETPLEPAPVAPGKDLWPELGIPKSAPPTRSLDFGTEPAAEPTDLPPSIPDLPVLRRAGSQCRPAVQRGPVDSAARRTRSPGDRHSPAVSGSADPGHVR